MSADKVARLVFVGYYRHGSLPLQRLRLQTAASSFFILRMEHATISLELGMKKT